METNEMKTNKTPKILLTAVMIIAAIISLATFLNIITFNSSTADITNMITIIGIIVYCACLMILEVMKMKAKNKGFKTLIPSIILVSVLIIVPIIYYTAPQVAYVTTGLYGQGSAEQNEMVDSILGKESARERFELYFYKHNVLHEIGHVIVIFNRDNRPETVDEEQLVNDFAVAFWAHYGIDGQNDELADIVSYAIGNFDRPAPANQSHLEYARENWGKRGFFTFNNYGWFQFSLVEHSLNNRKSLEEVLVEMGVKNVNVQPMKTLTYPSGEESVPKLIADAAEELRNWGVELPPFFHTFHSDPNRHMVQIKRNMFGYMGTGY